MFCVRCAAVMVQVANPEHPQSLFFLHVNKTAGTSMYRFLESHYPEGAIIADDAIASLRHDKNDFDRFITRLARYRLITKLHLHYGYLRALRGIDPNFRAVTIVRDPVARAYSQIEAWRRVPDTVLANVDEERRSLMNDARHLPASDFVDKYRARLDNRQARMMAGIETGPIEGGDDRLAQAALDAMNTIEFVGTTENLAPFAHALSWAMGFFPSFNPHRLNATPSVNRLSEEERQEIQTALRELNRADQILHHHAQRRSFMFISDTRYAQWSTSNPTTAAPNSPRNQPRKLAPGAVYRQGMDAPMIGDGWHEREAGVHGIARWAGPERFSSMYLPVDVRGSTVCVRLHVTSILDPALLDTISVFLDDHPAQRRVDATGTLPVLECRGPVGHDGGGTLKILVEAPASSSAYERYGVDDHRPKTLAIERIDVMVDTA